MARRFSCRPGKLLGITRSPSCSTSGWSSSPARAASARRRSRSPSGCAPRRKESGRSSARSPRRRTPRGSSTTPRSASTRSRWRRTSGRSRSTPTSRCASTCCSSSRCGRCATCSSAARIFNYLAAATPGLKELVTIGKIWELAQLDRKVKSGRKYDLVIVDAPATGHGIGFLQTPRTFAAIARVGPIHSQAKQLDRLITDQEHTGTAIVALPEEMPVNETAALEHDLRTEVGVAVDRVYMNGLYPRALLERGGREARRARPRRGRRRGPGRGARRRLRARPGPQPARPARPPAPPGRDAGQDPALPLRARDRGRGRPPPRQEARLMPSVDEILEGKDICICAGSGGVGKTTTSAAIATGMAARGLQGLRADDRPGEAARRLARPRGARQRGETGRPGAVRGPGRRDEGRALGDDARREGDLRRARRPPRRGRGVPRPGPRTTGSTSRSPAPSPARRSTWRWRSSSSCTARAASTCSSSTRRRPATRSTSSTRPNA